ncbi:hypothetical protein [Staphylococcus epidermidis]|uniref:hypothetical protein n=1 Tax=Staphylococcus epidermidis TaxID=1282 RepID=UPI00024E4837|nr:hypothetical protein [Staphylococcus epidermidis]EHS00355.1 hypothetical protein SEVCU128_0098 [Staphylococcus epidermidis VCU128]
MQKEKCSIKQIAKNVLVPFLVISIMMLAIGFDIQHKQIENLETKLYEQDSATHQIVSKNIEELTIAQKENNEQLEKNKPVKNDLVEVLNDTDPAKKFGK